MDVVIGWSKIYTWEHLSPLDLHYDFGYVSVSTTAFDSRIQCWANKRTLDPRGRCKLEIKEPWKGMKSERSSGKAVRRSKYAEKAGVRKKSRPSDSLTPGGLPTNGCALLPAKRQVLTTVVLKKKVF